MDKELAREIIACLPTDRTVFHYGKHGYALRLLSYLANPSRTVSELRKSRFARLLHTPNIKHVLAGCGHGLHFRQIREYCVAILPPLIIDFPYSFRSTQRREGYFEFCFQASPKWCIYQEFRNQPGWLPGKSDLAFFCIAVQ